jgi:hypothetical protein
MKRSLAILSSLALLTLLLVLSAYNWTGPDIWYHLYLGRRVLETFSVQPTDNLIVQQASFINIYWLFEVICQTVYSWSGPLGVSALFALLWVGIGWLWMRIVGVMRAPVLGLPLALVALLACSYRFDARPEIFSYLFLTLQIYWLCTWDLEAPLPWSRLLCFGAIEALWCNMHGYFPLGVCLVGLRVLCGALEAKGLPSRNLLKLLAVTILCSIASPLGYRTWEHVAVNWRILKVMHYSNAELLPPVGIYLKVWPVDLFWAWWALVALLAVRYLCKGKQALFVALLALPGLYLAASSLRNIPLAFLFAAPLVGTALRDARFGREAQTQNTAAIAAAVVSLLLSVSVVLGDFYRSIPSVSEFGVRVSEASYPVDFGRYLAETGFAGPLYNQSSDGGYLEYHFPALRLYADSRFYDTTLNAEYYAATKDPYVFQRIINRHPFQGILLNADDNALILSTLIKSNDWQLAYADLHRAFFLKSPASAWDGRALRRPQYYQGQDLSLKFNGKAAISWMRIMTSLDLPDQVVALLDAFSSARTVPAPVIGLALKYGMAVRNPGILARAASLRPKLYTPNPAEREAVDRLMEAASH